MLKVQNEQKCLSQAPADYSGAATTGDVYCLKGYDRIQFAIFAGAWAAGTAAVTLLQGTDVAFATNKALGFTRMWTNDADVTSPVLVDTAVVANTFNIDTALATYIIEVDADSLDVTNVFDCVRLDVASPGQNSDFYVVIADLYHARFAAAVMPSSVID